MIGPQKPPNIHLWKSHLLKNLNRGSKDTQHHQPPFSVFPIKPIPNQNGEKTQPKPKINVFITEKKKKNHLKLSKKYTTIMNPALSWQDDYGVVCTECIQDNTSQLPTSVDLKAGKSHCTNPLVSHPGRMHVALAPLCFIHLGSVEVISVPRGCLGDLLQMKFRIIFLGATW